MANPNRMPMTRERWMAWFGVRFIPEPNSGCWLWVGGTDGRYRYGKQSVMGEDRLAHRVAYEAMVGPIPSGLTIDHVCRTTLCVNTDHMRIVSMRENIMAGRSPWAINGARTHCKNGHAFSPENTRIIRHGRSCRECQRAYDRRRRPRKTP